MCIGGATQPIQKYAVRPDPLTQYVKGNIEDPLSDPFVQKDTSPVKKVAKKSSVTQSSSNDLNITSYT